MKKYYISTAIAYTSSRPHIGNVYEIVLSDAIARFYRLLGYDVYFQTGTDEHGQKIELMAKQLGLEPKDYVDMIAKQVKNEWDVLNNSYDSFVRTTDSLHKEKVQSIFKKLYEQGDIYLGKYEGLYCTPCESFFTETQLIDKKCPDCGRSVESAEEEAYFLNLNKYVNVLVKHIEDNPEFLLPITRRNEMLNFIKQGLQDLCVSRTSFKWGIPVSFNDKHIIYVWIDALCNYITFLDYNTNNENGMKFQKYWPADVHVVGKDIMRFHAIYWPIILFALNLELPKKIFGHPWLLSDNGKMSKSKANVIYASDLVKFFDVDMIRFYLLHEMSQNNDTIITHDLIIERSNAELANNLGNLVNRTLNMINQYSNGIIYSPSEMTDNDEKFIKEVSAVPNKVLEKMEKFQISLALDDVFEIFRLANKYIENTTPWVLAKNNEQKDRLQTVLYNLIEAIRYGAVLLQPFLPETAEKIFRQLNVDEKSFYSLNNFKQHKFKNIINQPEVLFERINKNDKMKAIQESTNN